MASRLEGYQRCGCDRGGVDAVLGVDLGLTSGLAEAVDAEWDRGNAEGAADEGECVAGAVDHGDDREAALAGCDEPLEV